MVNATASGGSPGLERAAALERAHANYCDYNQQERADAAAMVRLGHPGAGDYRLLRDFFDSLKYACNASTRYFSYQDGGENSEYSAPGLDLSWYPRGALARFGHVYPAHARWMEYVEAAAQAGWEGAEPRLDGGHWHISTRRHQLVEAIHAIASRSGARSRESAGASGATLVRVGIDANTRLHFEIAALLAGEHDGCILPKRTAADDAEDSKPLPLECKTFALGNVEKVTETPRAILVPLLPFGQTDKTLQAVRDVMVLLERGYPLRMARPWVADLVTPKALEQLDRRFGRQPMKG